MILASRIDHTLLKAEATRDDVARIIREAHEQGFASVCVNSCFTAQVAQSLRQLDDSAVKTCVVAGFPLGASTPTIKAIEAVSAIKQGGQEIDVVAHLPALLDQNLSALKAELMEITRAARSASSSVVIKVIVESALLLAGVNDATGEARIALACQAIRESGCDFIKTSTGFHPAGGASVAAVKLMKKHAHGLQVKASGGIRTRDDALRMIDAGADRLGCSASLAILNSPAS
jgi:deoxyribose-phosphate aldolase